MNNNILEFECNYIIEKLLSGRYGLIESLTTSDNYSPYATNGNIIGNLPNLFFSYANAKIKLSNGKLIDVGGCGASRNFYSSRVKALGECIERICGMECDDMELENEIHLMEKSEKYISLKKIVLFSKEQYEYIPFPQIIDSEYIYYTNMYSLSEKCNFKVPYQKVVLYDCRDQFVYNEYLSTGLACSYDLNKAILAGIYECIERDAFILNWRNKMICRKINLDVICNESIHELIDIISDFNDYKLYLYDIKLDINVNTILALLISNNTDCIGSTVSCATDLNPEKALYKALEELLLTNKFQYDLKFGKKKKIYNANEILDLDDYVIYFSNKDNNQYYNYIIDSSYCVNLSNMINYSKDDDKLDVEYIVKDISQKGYNVLYKDLTKTNIKKNGLSVVKVIITEFIDLNVNFSYRPLGGNRMKLFYNEDNYYDVPHPFP